MVVDNSPAILLHVPGVGDRAAPVHPRGAHPRANPNTFVSTLTNAVEHEFEVIGDRFLERAVEAMRHNISGDTTIEHLARNVGISSRQLRNIVRKHTGKSPAQFRREIRLHEAKWRLSETSQSITQIAYAADFADSAHLSRSFRALFGTTPRVYRQTRLTADSPADKVS